MPSATIEVRHAYSPEDELAMMQAVHGAIVEAFNVPDTHRNVSLVVHPPGRFLGRTDSPDPDRTTHVSIYVLQGRSLDAKRRLYRLVVEALSRFGIPGACVLIKLHEMDADNVAVRGGLAASDIDLGYRLDV
jgi:hypothetical protein